MNEHILNSFIEELTKHASKNSRWLCNGGGKAYKGRDLLKAKPRVRHKKVNAKKKSDLIKHFNNAIRDASLA